MKKYFVVSDIHGYFDIFHDALLKAGFEDKNTDHILIVCGDIFDRGKQPLEVYEYLKNLPKERRILIRGNHEYLLKQLVEREEPLNHDMHNRTYHTLFSFIGTTYEAEHEKENEFWFRNWGSPDYLIDKALKTFEKRKEKLVHRLFHNRKLNAILKWIWSDEWVPFYELGPYIFVHAFIPTCAGFDDDEGVKYTACQNWREYSPSNDSNRRAWEKATWDCPYKLYTNCKDSPELEGKIIVAGHWHTADWWNTLEGKNYEYDEFNPIFISENYPGIIGIDACTAATNGCNVLVINEDMSLDPHDHRKYIIKTISEEK